MRHRLICKYIRYCKVKPKNIMKLKHYTHERNFVVKCEGDSLVWNQHITRPKEKNVWDMAYYIPTVWKSGGSRPPCPPPNCTHDYMHNGLSFYQIMYCKATFLALPRLSYIIFNGPVVVKTTLLRPKLQQTHYHYRIATKLAKAY